MRRSRFDVNQQFIADYALTATDNFTPTGVASANALHAVPGVGVVSGVRAGEGRAFRSPITVSGVAPDIGKVIHIQWQAGSAQTPGQLGTDGALVSKAYAEALHLRVGSREAVQVPSGAVLHLFIRGITNPPKGGSPLGDVTISQTLFDASFQNPQNVYTFVNIAAGLTAANTHRLEAALGSFPDAKLQTKCSSSTTQEAGLDTLLNLLYMLLSLSIIVSLFGIVNTLC